MSIFLIFFSRRTGKYNENYLRTNLIHKNFIFISPKSKKINYLEENKKILNDNAQISSKKLRNQIAGYISKTMNNESEISKTMNNESEVSKTMNNESK